MAIILAKYVPLKRKKLNRSIVARYCMLCVTFLARCVVTVMLSGLAC